MDDKPKRGRGRPPLTEEQKQLSALKKELGIPGRAPSKLIEPGDNAKYLAHAMAIRNMPPINNGNSAEVEERINWYFNHCINSDMKPTVKGLCNALKISRDTIWRWKNGLARTDICQEIILQAYDLLEEMWENYMQNGKINPMAGVFLGVNNFGYKDVKQVNLTPVMDNNNEAPDLETIEAKYAELPEA